MDDRARGLTRHGARLLGAARRLLAVVAPLVPRRRRAEWLGEWDGELYHHLTRRAARSDVHTTLDLVARLAGTIPHALWLRRDEWRLDMIAQDLAFALRTTRKRPAFSALVVGTLALGIGANTAMFTIVNSVLLQPLPYARSHELVYMFGSFSQARSAAISPPDFLDYRAGSGAVLSALAARTVGAGDAVLTGNGDPERVAASDVTANFFSTLGVAPLHGRTFRAEEEEGDGHAVVILAYGLWQRRFGGNPAVVGTTTMVNGHAAEIIGIMPPVLDRTLQTQLWRPIPFHTPGTTVRRFHFLRALGRLQPGVTIEQAQAALDVIAKQLEATYPENETWKLRLVPYREFVVGNVGRSLFVLLGAVGLVLLIACGNVASLLLARATSREGEMAIRTALGASRTRLVRQLLTESLLLAVVGGAAGLALAAGLVRAVRLVADGILPRLGEVAIDRTVLLFTVVLALGTGLVFGLAPALHAVRTNLVTSLSALGRSATSASRRGVGVRDMLVVAQVALSIVLLTGAGLLLRSLWTLQRVAPGFEASRVLTTELSLSPQRYGTPDAVVGFWDAVTERARAAPGVVDASATTMLPFVGGGDTYFWIDGKPPASAAERRTAQVSMVADRYFETMRIPLLSGRAFAPSDRGGSNVIVINRRMAAKLFPGERAIGQRLSVDFGRPFVAEIVGVVGDVHAFGLENPEPDIMYFSVHQPGGFGRARPTLVVRTQGDPLALTAALRSVVASIDRDVPLANLRTLEDVVSGSTTRQQFGARLLSGFAVAALLLAVIGLYGVLAFAVSQRTRELGIRIALGAGRRQMLRLVIQRGMLIVTVGITLGLAAALAATKLVEGMLFQVGRTDPVVFVTVTLALAVAAFVACVVPARRATRVDPVVALRDG